MNEQDKVQSPEQEQQVEQEQVQLSDEQQIIAKLEAELDKARTTAAEQTDLALRVRAEAENMKRRAAQDVEKAHKFALEKFAGDLLPVLDNLERSLSFIDPANEAVKALAEGVELTLKGLLDTVAKYGVQQIDPQGQPFNPDFHQAMSIQPHAELAPNTVMFVMQKGYELNGRLLRPAMVGVSKKPD
ncbi:MAG: nucleotide exchange factor GrpE [Rheinheimera sp.]|nr:MAG: nucleotide exchange factor GrpE [Rheinheimera sp.]